MSSEPTISVVIPTYNRKDFLQNCLESLFAQNYPKNKYEILVADDGSTDGTEEVVESMTETYTGRVRYLRQPNKGPAAARNLGIKKAKGEIVAFIDDDCIADKEYLSSIVKCFDEDDGLAGVEGKVISTQDKTPFTHQVENLTGSLYLTANIAYTKDILHRVGLFDETFPFPAAEDWELAYKVLALEKKIKFCEKSIVIHPPRKRSLKNHLEFVKGNWPSHMKLYKMHPNEYKKYAGHSVWQTIFEYVFLNPILDIIKWKKYFLSHPMKLPLFIVRSVLGSFYTLFIVVKQIIKCY